MIRWKNRLKNRFITYLLTLLRKKRPHSFDPKNPRILIVSTTALGDTLWSTFAFRSIKKKFPSSFLAVLTQKVGEELFKNNPYVDECISFKEPLFPSLFSLLFLLRSKKFQAIFVFHASQRLIFPLAALLGAERILGISGRNKGLDPIFTDLIENAPIHELEKRKRLLALLEIPSPELNLLYYPSPIEEERALGFLKEKNLLSSKLLIVLHPGANDAHRRWPKESFIALGKKLLQSFDCHLLISGTSQEKELILSICSQIEGSIPLFPSLPLRDFAALLKKVDLLIANDTGPSHLSLAVGTKTLALFLPTRPEFSGPYQVAHGFALTGTPCVPCLQRKCPNAHCWEQISPDAVLEKVKSILSKESP